MEPDVAHDLATEIGGRGEDAAADEVALDLGEPDLDLVEPGAVGRRVVDLDGGMFVEPLLHGFGLMSGEVVADHMDLSLPGLGGNDPVEEGDEGLAGVPLSGHAL